jgi:curved DNA-binding protein CbpA
MEDPYKILGVSPTATDEEIKTAYRELAKKYHPDRYAGSPLRDLASEKMAQINDAYDRVQAQRRAGGPYSQTYSGPGQGQQGQYYRQSNSRFSDIRRLLTLGRIYEADELLSGVPTASRDAEWSFLKGNVLYSRGFLEDALTHFEEAARREPQNPEYRAALEQVRNHRYYTSQSGGFGYPYGAGCGVCDLCSAMICADCTCSMFRCCCS